MTKKHFESFARLIRDFEHPTVFVQVSYAERAFAAFIVAEVAECDNPRFDRSRFLRACGLEN